MPSVPVSIVCSTDIKKVEGQHTEREGGGEERERKRERERFRARLRLPGYTIVYPGTRVTVSPVYSTVYSHLARYQCSTVPGL